MKYIKYEPFFKFEGSAESTNVVAENIIPAQKIAFKNLNLYIEGQSILKYSSESERNINWLANKLNSSRDELIDILSPEQMDSVGFAIYNIENSSEFIVGDETGIGKGRILSSISRYALNSGKNVLFFTEGASLFSDLWRDLEDTNSIKYISNLESGPFLLHSKAKIYDFNSGELIYKSLSDKNLKNIISTGKFEKTIRGKNYDVSSNLILTTYTQFNRIITAKNKLTLLKKFITKDTVIIFDEFHNSIGESFINKIKEDIKKIGGIAIYSSATFLDDFKKINSFLNILNISKNDKKVIDSLINNKNSSNLAFSNQLAFIMTKNNKLLRREHTNIDKINYVYMDGDISKELNLNLNKYKKIVLKIFNCYKIISKYKENNIKNKWVAMGSTINRLTKILILTHKKEFLLDRVNQSLKDNKKCVIVLESTFESLIKTCIEYKNKSALKEIEKLERIGVNFNEDELDKMLPDDTLFSLDDISFKTLLLNILNNLLLEYVEELDNKEISNYFKSIINDIEDFPHISLSLIDDIKNYFKNKNINALEISGRSLSLNKVDDHYVLSNIKNVDKSVTVKDFNDGNSDVIILTRSGSTGLSLHSSSKFKDQRVRKMFELEITPRAKVRLQFFGRIKRRGQVNEPEFETIVSNTPFEKRIISLEEKKLLKLRSFVGSDFKVNSLDFDYFNEFTNYLAKIYLVQNYETSSFLGIYPYTDEHMYHIDMLLKRSILLDDDLQNKIFNYLDSGNYVYTQLSNNYESDILKTYTDNLYFTSVKPIISNLSSKDLNEYNNITRQNMIDTDLPVVSLAKSYNEIKLNNISKEELVTILKDNLKLFDLNEFIKNLSFVNINLDYGDNKKIIFNNLKKIKNIKIGSQIKFNLNNNIYYGYIEDISYPSKMFNDYFLSQYITHYLFKIRLINPINLNSNNRITSDTIFIMGSILLENNNFEIYDKEINFEKFERKCEIVKQDSYMLVGNIFYINYIYTMYDIGELISFNKSINGDNKQIFSLKLPNNFNDQTVNNIFNYKPIFTSEHGMHLISIGKVVKTLDNSINIWKNNKNSSNVWIIKVNNRIIYDEDIVHFKNKKILDRTISKNDGDFVIFSFYNYKEFCSIYYSLFYNNKIYLSSNY